MMPAVSIGQLYVVRQLVNFVDNFSGMPPTYLTRSVAMSCGCKRLEIGTAKAITCAAYAALHPGEPVNNAPADILGTTRTMVTWRGKLRTALLRIIKERCEVAPFSVTQMRAERPEERTAQGARAVSDTPGLSAPARVAAAADASLSAPQADRLSAAQGAHTVPVTPGLSTQAVIAPTASATVSGLDSFWNEVGSD